MKSVLFLGNRKKSITFINYCIQNNYHYIILDKKQGQYLSDEKLTDKTIFLGENFTHENIIKYLNEKQFTPDFVYCFNDDYVELECELTRYYKCINNFDNVALQFLKYKSVQNKICEELDIPIIEAPTSNDKVISKPDFGVGGGHGMYIGLQNKDFYVDGKFKKEQQRFIQKYIDIDYTTSCHIHIKNNGNWIILNHHKANFIDNCIDTSEAPYFPPKNEMDIILDAIEKLSNKLNINHRIVFWQFVKTSDGQIYNLDFNPRISGSQIYRKGMMEFSDTDWAKLLLENKTEEIKYTRKIYCKYLNKQLFGYSDSQLTFKNYVI